MTPSPSAGAPHDDARRGWRAVLGMAGTLAVGATLALWWGQERLIFPGAYLPQPSTAELKVLATRAGATQLELIAEDGTHLAAWYTSAGGRRAVLYIGGNAESLPASRPLAEALAARGWDTLALAPRGFPGSDGAPSEQGFASDVDAAVAWLARSGLPPSRWVFHGRSLGGGTIAAAAARHHPAGVVLESTFTSVRAMAARRFPLLPTAWLLRHPFDVLAVAHELPDAVFVAHAVHDEVVPFEEGSALAAAIPGATWAPGAAVGHQRSVILADPDVRAAWERFLDGVAAGR